MNIWGAITVTTSRNLKTNQNKNNPTVSCSNEKVTGYEYENVKSDLLIAR